MQKYPLITAIAACSQQAGSMALAACFFELQAPDASTNLVEIQVTPAGAFRPRDGRELPVDAWRIDAAIAARVIDEFKRNATPLVLDYEHQTITAQENGQPAPAAGFFRELEWRDGVGLFARVELTARARQYVADGEYRFFSPVFRFDPKTGELQALLMGALTNNPALDGMAEIAVRAAARFQTTHGEPQMINKHLLAVCVALAIATEGKDEAQLETAATAAIAALKTDPLAQLRAELNLGADVGAAEISTAVAALKSKANGNPDPSKFVGVEVVESLRRDIAALSATNQAREVDELVAPALEDGRLLPAQEKWARDLGKSDIAALRSYLESAEPIAALRSTQTRGADPAQRDTANEHGLTAAELAVCAATGIAAKDFAAAKTR
jgi:phage I-like protein